MEKQNALMAAWKIIRQTFCHLKTHWRFLALQMAVPMLFAILLTFLMLSQEQYSDMWMVFAGILLFSFFVYVPLIVVSHRIVLYGRQATGDGLYFKFDQAEWRLILFFIELSIYSLIPITLMQVLLKWENFWALFVVPHVVVIIFVSLFLLAPPIIVAGQPKPFASSFRLFRHNAGLILLLCIPAFIISEMLHAGAERVGSLMPGIVNGAPFFTTFLPIALWVVIITIGATGLSFLYLHVTGQERLASSAAQEPVAQNL